MSDNPYGITIGNPSATGTLNPQAITDMNSLGITWLRYQVPWSAVDATGTTNQNTATYHWNSWDSAVNLCNNASPPINIILTIFKADTQFQLGGNPDAPSFAATFAAQVATRYDGAHGHGTIAGLELGNEDYDNSSGTSAVPLVATMKTVYPAVKAVSSSIKVGVASLLQRNSAHYTSFMETLLNPSTGAYIGGVFQGDYLNFHYYCGIPQTVSGGPPVDLDPTHGYPAWNNGQGIPSIDQAWALIQAKMTQYSLTIPVWCTETGWQTNTNPGRPASFTVTQALQWQYLQAVLDSCRQSGTVNKVFIFTLGYFVYPNNARDGMSLVQGTTATPAPTIAYNRLATYIASYGQWAGGGGGGGGTGGGALTVYFTNTASVTTTTANKLYATLGNPANVNKTSALGAATGWGEVTSQGTATAWAAAVTAPAPTGKGFFWDSTNLEGNTLQAGTYTGAVRLNTIGAGAVTITADIHARLYKHSLAGVYTLIADCVQSAQSILTTKTVFAPTFTTSSNTPFITGDRLYVDILLQVTANTGASTQQIQLNDLSTDTTGLTGMSTANVATPGYQLSTGGGGGGGGNTATNNPYGLTIGFNIGNNNTNYAYFDTTPGLFYNMKDLVLTWVRLNYSWQNIERTQGVYSWGVLDDAVKKINASGYNLLYCLRNAPDWALTTAGMNTTSEPWYLPDPAKMAVFAAAVMQRYNGGQFGRIDALGYNEDFNIHFTPSTVMLTLNSTITNGGGPYTTLSITPAPAPYVGATQTADVGTKIYFGGYSNTTDVATVSSAVAVGDTTVHISSFTPAVTYSSGGHANLAYVASGNSTVTNPAYAPLYNPGSTGTTGANLHKGQPSRDAYYAAQVAKAVYAAVRAVNSTIPIGMPCIWWTQGQNTQLFGAGTVSNHTAFLSTLYDLGAPFDFIDFHYYSNKTGPDGIKPDGTVDGTVNSITQAVADLNHVSASKGDPGRAIWLTEFGWQVPQDTNASTQATRYQEVLDAIVPDGSPNKAFFFTLWFAPTGGTGSSLLNTDGTYQPAYTTLKNYIAAHPGTGGGGGGGGGGGTGGSGPPLTGKPNQTVIGGASYFVEAGTMTIDRAIGRRSTASATVKTQDTLTHFQQDQTVALYDQNGNLAFSGYVAPGSNESKPGIQSTLEHTLQFVDQHRLADKRVVAASFKGKSASFIVQYIVTNILAQEGVIVGQIYDGPLPSDTLYPDTTLYPDGSDSVIPNAVFAYCTAADALDSLAKGTSTGGIPYYWQIDASKQLWFVPYTSIVNPVTVDGSLVDNGTASGQAPIVTRSNPTYANTTYVAGGVSQTVEQFKTFYGTASQSITNWTLDYDVQSVISIKVNNVRHSFGVKGVDSGKDFYYAVGDPIITQDTTFTPLLDTDQLIVRYIGQYPSIFVSQNAAQISYEQSLDNSSGIVESVVSDTTITSSAAGLAKSAQLLQRYATQGIMAQFNTQASGYAPGQMITVNLPMHNLNNQQMLIEEVSYGDHQSALPFWYTIYAIVGPYDVTWTDFFSNLIQQSNNATQDINVGISSTLVILTTFYATLAPTASITTSLFSVPVPNTTLFPSTTLYPG